LHSRAIGSRFGGHFVYATAPVASASPRGSVRAEGETPRPEISSAARKANAIRVRPVLTAPGEGREEESTT
jgi:hypothetical protein